MTTWSILLDESCKGKEKYRPLQVIREVGNQMRADQAETLRRQCQQRWGADLLDFQVGGSFTAPNGASVVKIMYRYRDFDYFVDVENVSQLMDVLQQHPDWVLGRKYTGPDEPITFFEISDWEMP